MAQMKPFTWYECDTAPAVPGMIATSSLNVIDSFTAEEEIEAGKAVERGTNPAEQVKLCTAAEKTLGIAVHIHAEPGEAYAKDKRVAVMTFGDIAVTAGGDVAAGKAAEMNASGKFVASTKATGLTFMTSGAADDVVIVRVRK